MPTSSPSRDPASLGLTHPLVFTAAALMLANDLVLRRLAPGWLSGKLSDVGFLILAPVLAAAALGVLGVRQAVARRAAVVGCGAAFVVLQLWPPLGHWFSPSHVADGEDLLVLPALLGALAVWRWPSLKGVSPLLVLPVSCWALVATTPTDPRPDASWPCEALPEWPTATPLRLRLDRGPFVPMSDGFLRGMELREAGGALVPLVSAYAGDGTIAVCARAGLLPDTEYVWTLGPWGEAGPESNEVPYEYAALPSVEFRTTGEPGRAAPDAAACAAAAEAKPALPEDCEPPDTGGAMDAA
jgi:hypothetical protein